MNTTSSSSMLAPSTASNGHSSALNAVTKPLAAHAPVANQTVYLRLGDIGIDIQQPRRWMCADLRAKVADDKCNHAEAMLELLTRASRNDLEATGYVDTLRLLADDIAEIGMHTPIRVRLTPGGTLTRYTLVHGERRLWVCLYLATTQNLTLQATLATTIEAIVDAEAGEMSPEEIRRLQWSENLQREDVPLIDFACEVGQVYEAMYAHADLKRHEALADLGWQDDEQATSQVALALAEIEIKRATGRAIQSRTILLYARFTEKIGESAKALARAYHLGKRDLNQLTKLTGDAQFALTQKIISNITNTSNPIETVLNTTSPTTDLGGRPNRAQHFINLLARIPERVNKTTDRQLAQLEPEQLQTMLLAAAQTRELLESYGKRIQAILQRPGLAAQ